MSSVTCIVVRGSALHERVLLRKEFVMGELVAKCFVIVKCTMEHFEPARLIYLQRPEVTHPDYMVMEFDDVFTAKRFIQTHVKSSEIKIVGGAA